jgi:hypothetical protein
VARWSLTALIRELEEQMAGLQDVADQASHSRSPRALAGIQRQLHQTGIDSRIVVSDIVRYAQDLWWKHGVLDFTDVAPRDLQQKAQPTPSLVEFLQQGQITDGQRVSRLETDLREVLSTSAELASAGENLRLQRMVVWLSVIAVIATIVAAAAAVIALVIALRNSSGPAAKPSTHAANTPVHAPGPPANKTPPDNAGSGNVRFVSFLSPDKEAGHGRHPARRPFADERALCQCPKLPARTTWAFEAVYRGLRIVEVSGSHLHHGRFDT